MKLFSLYQLFSKKQINKLNHSLIILFSKLKKKKLMYGHDVNEALYQNFEILGHWIDYLTFLQL